MSAPARREQVAHLNKRGVSQRRACELLSVARSTMTYEPRKPAKDAALVKTIRGLAEQHPRYGYRRIGALLERDGEMVNHKRVYRVWRQEGLSLRRRKRRRRTGPRQERPPVATRPGQVWAYDFAHDRCADGRALKCLVAVDEYSRECLALTVERRIDAHRVIETLKRLMDQYGAPEHIRSDNGPEFVAQAVQEWLDESGIGPVYIAPGKPWENGVAESFIGKLRDECLSREWFLSPAEAQVITERYRRHYNAERPHSSLGYATPAEFRALTWPNGPRERQKDESLTLELVR